MQTQLPTNKERIPQYLFDATFAGMYCSESEHKNPQYFDDLINAVKSQKKWLVAHVIE